MPVAKRRFPGLLGSHTATRMSTQPDLNLDYVANLARLTLTDAEKAEFSHQLGDILRYVDKLKQVDVSGVEPMAHAAPVFNVWQADVAAPGLSVEAALRNAPARRQDMIVVPKVVE